MRAGLLALLAAVALLLAGCTSARVQRPAPSVSSSTDTSRSATATSPAPRPTATMPTRTSPSRPLRLSPTPAQRALAKMSLAQRIGQLFMVGTESGTDDATVTAIADRHVGSVLLLRQSTSGVVATAAVTHLLKSRAGAVPLFVATDQEGGDVQRMRGPGFTDMPSALEQGRLDPASLRSAAGTWGTELRRAGIDLDLAPVLDTVPPGTAADNPPIGALDRQFGSDPVTVTAHGLAVIRGLAGAGVLAAAKHFPGLGRVTGNTDVTSGVVDAATTRDDPYLAPFRAAVAAGVPFVMMSTAVYTRLDPNAPAAFSRAIVSGVLRRDLGFHGVVISDDLGAAAQVADVPIAERALRFLDAGGDIVLTADARQIPEMTDAVLRRVAADPAFRPVVDAAALRVLTAKQAHGLLR